MKKHPRLQSVLLLVNLVILLLPLGGIAVFRLYESELVKQTEASLIGQGALVATAFRHELARQFNVALEQGDAFDLAYGNPLSPQFSHSVKGVYDTVPPRLDIAKDPVLPQGRAALPPAVKPDVFALAAGEALLPIILSSKNITLTGTRIVDHRGTVVASSGTEMGLSLMNREEVPRALKGEHVSLLRERGDPPAIGRQNRVRVFVAIPVIYGDRVWGAVILSRTPLDLNKGLYLIRWRLIEAGLILAGVLLALTIFTTRLISRPVKALIQQAEMVAAGERDAAPLARPGTREVARLSEALTRMAQALSERADKVRTFADNVSHGFKTPLTSLSGTIELLRDPQVEMTAQERDRFLEMMEADIARLDRLVKKLLDLARADTTSPGRAAADVLGVINGLEEKYRNQGRAVAITRPNSRCAVAMAPEILESVLVILLENAWAHNGPEVQVRVSVREDFAQEEHNVVITVSDNGKGVSPANARKIFIPFFTTAAQQGGSGMGLAIAASLVQGHGGALELAPGGPGADFAVTLPFAHPSPE